jgi:hypothetical protein
VEEAGKGGDLVAQNVLDELEKGFSHDCFEINGGRGGI